MQHRILIPLDGSERAEAILPHAEVLAQATGSALTLLRVVALPVVFSPALGAPPPLTLDDDLCATVRAAAAEYLATLAAQLTARGLEVETLVDDGDPASVIIAWAAQDPPQRLIAIATHGRSGLGRWVFGSVAEKVLQAAPTPLLLIRSQVGDTTHQFPAHPYRTILVPLDGSRLAEQALAHSLPLARATGATLVLGSVVTAPPDDLLARDAGEPAWVSPTRAEETAQLGHYLEQVAARLRVEEVTVRTRIATGHPAAEILRLGEEVGADLMMMATHGRGGFKRLWLGSVALKVVQGALCPVLLIRV
jgi:nucleotide-binding universal stress UspA family protein